VLMGFQDDVLVMLSWFSFDVGILHFYVDETI